MDEPADLRIDPNTADAQALQRLPGVGPALAERLIAARPLRGPEDMLRVSGVSEAVLERMAPHLVFEAPPPDEPPAPPARPAASRPPQGALSRRQAYTLAGATGLASTLLAIVLTLLVLAGINGSLSIAGNRAVRQLGSDLQALQRTLEGTESRLQSLESRLTALEGLSGRMASVEAEAQALRLEVESVRSQMQAVRGSLRLLSEANQALARRADAYDAFFAGLQQLLGPLVPAAQPAPTPTP